ncbi:conserved exported hypothetical protein [uncultured Paludibacter sp.]|nr:conserved exported hypothetical protein [uncultured Paludibacter sp.]
MKRPQFTFIFFFFLGLSLLAQSQSKFSSSNIFKIKNPDYTLSPYTGMTRQHWFDAAQYLLEGAFSYVHTLDDPMKFPKQPGKSYPTKDSQISTEKLEGLCRTLFVAAPLLKQNPDLEINNVKVADYYRHQICNLINPQSSSYIKHRGENGGPHQNLVEFGALAISLFTIPEIIWEPLTQSQKDSLKAVMISYGDGPTISSNWKFFNIFILSFFKQQGYHINDKLLIEYLQKSLEDYRGEGWYNDHPAYDYYSMWAYQLYGTLWSTFFGNKYYPEIAKQFLSNFKDAVYSYPYMFDRNGKMIMWGRSISYRFASIGIFPFMGTLNEPNINLGWMRKIASETLLQFLENPNFLKDRIPTLGFYGAFEPAVQIYSCRGSVFWMGKAFLGLFLPANNLFWTSKENLGPWENEMKKGNVYNHFQKESNILITNYPNSGVSEIRAWCHEKVKDDWQLFRSTENYNRLAYNSAFPWQADGENGEVAMNYVIKNPENKWETLRLYTFKKFENGIYYRDAEIETNPNIKFKLADIPLSNGILRVDKIISPIDVDIRLGHYALPEKNNPIQEITKKIKGQRVNIIDNGEYQLAMVSWNNTGKLEFIHVKNLHPESVNSTVINMADSFVSEKNREKIYITLQLWKKSGEKWGKEELIPISKVIISKDGQSVEVVMKDKTIQIVHF